jgi:glycosyltransferase involved in cell wall biosynthesis
MEDSPRFSIVTPSFNQGKYIAETIESVMAQNYANVEHIIIDGGSTDETPEILERYPHLRVISEPDHGQADAINKGFRLASGDIMAFLNSDDTLLPGALHSVSKEIAPQQGRYIVMGRCRFVDENGCFFGVEHPSHFESHKRLLQIWKGHMIPQPAVFWAREVWENYGPMKEDLDSPWIDYDLFCRFSQRYSFHCINQLLATYRLHVESKTGSLHDPKRLEDSIRISRRYWGKPWSMTYWQLAISLALYRINRTGRGVNLLRKAQESWRQKRILQTVPLALAGGIMAPEVAFYAAIYPPLRNFSSGVLRKILSRMGQMGEIYPQTAAHLDNTDPWGDGWVGPRLVVTKEITRVARTLVIEGWVELSYMPDTLYLKVLINGDEVGNQRLEESGEFALRFVLPAKLSPGEYTVEVQSTTWYVPHRFLRNQDFRPLSWRMAEIKID